VAQKAYLSFKNRFPYISLIDKTSNFKFGMQLGMPRPIIKYHQKKSGCGRRIRELPEIWGFPFNITATAEASDFKFGTQLGFAKAHHKITPRGKSKRGLGLGELPKIFRVPL